MGTLVKVIWGIIGPIIIAKISEWIVARIKAKLGLK